MREWDAPVSPEEREAVLNRIADEIARRRMETPAILFLEMHRPLSFIASQSLVATSAFVAPFIGIENVQIASQLLADRSNVERLIDRIEECAQKRDQKATAVTEGA